MDTYFVFVLSGSVYLSGYPQRVTHLHLAANPAAWTRHPLYLHLAPLNIHNTVVPTQHIVNCYIGKLKCESAFLHRLIYRLCSVTKGWWF